LSELVFPTNITRTGQTVYIEVVVEEITIIKVFRETLMETALEEVVSGVVNLIIDIIYYHHSLNKRSTIYIGSLNTN
jgi:hypothetical protein